MALNPVSYIFKDTVNTVLDEEGNEHQSVTSFHYFAKNKGGSFGDGIPCQTLLFCI